MIVAIGRAMPPLGWAILAAALVLSGMGVLGIYAGEADVDGTPAATLRQLGFVGIGLIGFVAVQWVGYRRLGRYAYPLFGLTLLMLILLVVARQVPLAPIVPVRRHTCRWIVLGPLNFQVSEYAKIVYVLALAAYLRFRTNYRTLRGLLGPFVLTIIPVVLILKEPDLGTSLLLLPTMFVMLFVAGAKYRHIFALVALGAAAAPVFYFSPLISDYQKARVVSFLAQDESDKEWRLNSGYQLNQSLIAIGSGGLMGQGFGQGAFFRHDLLPEEHNDFIFAVLAHQWGFVGALLVLGCYFAIITAGLIIASMTVDPLGRLLAVGICAMLAVQTIVNIGMTAGLMMITGMSLPFVSSGGSAVIAYFLGMGLLASVARPGPVEISRKPFEFDHAD